MTGRDLIVLGTDGTIQERLNYGTGTGFGAGTTISSGWQNFLGQSGQGVLSIRHLRTCWSEGLA